MMISPPRQDLPRPIHLLQKQQSAQFMRQRHVAQAQNFLADVGPHGVINAVGAAEEEDERATGVARFFEELRELHRRLSFAKFVQQPDVGVVMFFNGTQNPR